VSAEPAPAPLLARCDDALAALLGTDTVRAGTARSDAAVSFAVRAHLRRCARCRQAVAEHRTVQGRLRALQAVPAPGEAVAREGLVAGIVARLDAEDLRARRARLVGRFALAGGVVAGIAAAGVVAVTRGRRVALALSLYL
jgi:hypothetical protein